MTIIKEINSSPIILDDPAACRLVKARAIAEDRSARSALRLTITEALQSRYQRVQDKPGSKNPQAKNRPNFLDEVITK